MTLPSSGAISLSQVDTELGRASNAAVSLGETAVRSMAGVSSGAISMSNLYGKSAITFSPVAGSYTSSGPSPRTYTITASAAVVWTWTKTSTGPGGTANVTSGSSATSITFTVNAAVGSIVTHTFSVDAGGKHWDLTITADNSGGGGV